MIRAAALIALVAAPSAFAYGMWSGQNTPSQPTLVGARQNAPLVSKPGWGDEGAAKYLAKVNPPPPPPPPKPGSLPPPPPDVAVVLRRQVSGVMAGGDGQPRLILAGARSLKLGDVYQDGWTMTGLTNQSVTLKKGKEMREVNLFTPIPSIAPTPILASLPSGPISFTNGTKAGQLSSAQVAKLLGFARRAGLPEQAITQLQQQLASSAITGQQIAPLLILLGRSGSIPATELTAFLQDLGRTGVIPANQVAAYTQQIAQSGPNPLNGLIQQLGRAGQNGGRGGPGGAPGGFGGGVPGGGGGPGGFGGGGGNRGGGGGGGGRNRGQGGPGGFGGGGFPGGGFPGGGFGPQGGGTTIAIPPATPPPAPRTP